MVERQFAASHEAVAAELINQPEARSLLRDGGEGLVPVQLPKAQLAISYLYGGGFLNPTWGERKLAMLGAVEDLVAGAARVVRLASGQQVDPGWIDGLDPAGVELLRRFELWGARDDASVADPGQARDGRGSVQRRRRFGRDPRPRSAAREPPEEFASPLEVNVHFAEHEWVTDSPDAVREFDVRLLAELSRLAGRPLRVRPLLAYLDPRIDERQDLERFASACAEQGIELTEPCVLRPTGIAAITGDLSRAALTVSSSYHVALTSLLLAVPAVILRDNEYYAQKARGLLSDFDLPPEFSPRSSDDPERAAAAIAPHLLDPDLQSQTRRGLEMAASRVRQRRAESEARLLALIAATLAATGTSANPTPGPTPDDGRAAAERRAVEAEAKLAEVLSLTILENHRSAAPLREAWQELNLDRDPHPTHRRPAARPGRAVLRGAARRRRAAADLVPQRDRGGAERRRRAGRLPDAGDAKRRHPGDR